MITLTKTSVKTIEPQQDSINLENSQKAYFLQEVLEGLQDGILILTETGELVHANASAYRISHQLNQNYPKSNFVPLPIWQLCQSLVESRDLFSNQHIILSDEIVIDKFTVFRVRVRWLELDRFERPCLLVTIENRYESLQNIALAEVKKYELTPREAEIWFLYRYDYSYKEIAAQLFITINTVKKHMKSIHAKRQQFLSLN